MFKGVDRAKYDLKDPSAWTALERDRALHVQALAMVERHLKSQMTPVKQPRVPQILLPADQQAALTTEVPAQMQSFMYDLFGKELKNDIK